MRAGVRKRHGTGRKGIIIKRSMSWILRLEKNICGERSADLAKSISRACARWSGRGKLGPGK